MNSRGRALAVLIAVLLLGGLLGASGMHYWGKWFQGNRSNLNPRREQGGPDRLVERLHLSPEQQKQLKTIFEESRRQLDAVRAEMGPKFDAVRTHTNDRIAAMLNDDQKKQFEKILKEMDERRGPPGTRGDRGGRPPTH